MGRSVKSLTTFLVHTAGEWHSLAFDFPVLAQLVSLLLSFELAFGLYGIAL